MCRFSGPAQSGLCLHRQMSVSVDGHGTRTATGDWKTARMGCLDDETGRTGWGSCFAGLSIYSNGKKMGIQASKNIVHLAEGLDNEGLQKCIHSLSKVCKFEIQKLPKDAIRVSQFLILKVDKLKMSLNSPIIAFSIIFWSCLLDPIQSYKSDCDFWKKKSLKPNRKFSIRQQAWVQWIIREKYSNC